MKDKKIFFIIILILTTVYGGFVLAEDYKYLKTVIAHRGASGYLPEHTLEAVAMAYAMKPDFIEPDVVLTRDNQAIVLHDIHLDTTTNVAEVFPDRKRSDGRYYAIDFDLAEIKSLAVHERTKKFSDKAVFPDRFPLSVSSFRIPTLQEEIELLIGLNTSMGSNIGIYPEIKEPAFHYEEGKDISRIVIEILYQYDLVKSSIPLYLQCFDLTELERIKSDFGSEINLIYLLNAKGVDRLVHASDAEIEDISTIASGLGVSINGLLHNKDKSQQTILKLHEQGLLVHAWTVRKDSLPSGYHDIEALLKDLDKLAVDGVFTDFSDLVVALVKK